MNWNLVCKYYLRRSVVLNCRGREVFELLSGNRWNEIEVIRSVYYVFEILSDPLQIFVRRLAEVDGRNVRNRIPFRVEKDVKCHTQVSQLLDVEQWRENGLANLEGSIKHTHNLQPYLNIRQIKSPHVLMSSIAWDQLWVDVNVYLSQKKHQLCQHVNKEFVEYFTRLVVVFDKIGHCNTWS